MASTGVVTNYRSMNGIISFDDGSGGLLENGQLTAEHLDSNTSDITSLTIDTNLTLGGTLTTNTNVITNVWVSYLYGLTGNIQAQISGIIANVLSTNNIWTGTNTYNNTATFNSTVNGLTKTTVGLGNVDNTSDANKPISTATQTALNLKANIASPTFTGTVSGVTKAMVGLGNCDNTSDANKPVSTATQTALNLKADLASPTFTGTVSGITKAMVGLGNVDNTSDANKPVSTATQTALNLKADLASPLINNLRIGYSAAQPTFGGGSCGGLAGNLSAGNTELDFVNSGVNFSNPAINAFNWYILTSSTTKSLIASMKTNGDFSCGVITSSTITGINTNIATKLDANGGTWSAGIADYMYIKGNSGGNLNPFPTNTYAGIVSNFSAGDGELALVGSPFNYPSGRSCSWYQYINTSTASEILTLMKNGDLQMTGVLTGPTVTSITASIATKQDIVTSSNRLSADLIGTGIVSNTEYNYLDGVTSAIQTQINTVNTNITTANTNIATNTTNISTNTSNISTINTTLTGYASAFTTTKLTYTRSICGVDRTSAASTSYTIASMPTLTVLQASGNVNLPDPSSLPEGQLWAVMLMGGFSTTITATGGGNPFWYAGGSHASFAYSNANKRKQFCTISSLWTVLED